MDLDCRSSVYTDSCGISRGECQARTRLLGVQVQRFFSTLVNVGGKEQRREIGKMPRATWMLYITPDPDLERIRIRASAERR